MTDTHDARMTPREGISSGVAFDGRAPDQVGPEDLKMWLLVRRDLPMSGPKLAGQSGHAFFSAAVRMIDEGRSDLVERYVNDGQAKIVVGVKGEDQLRSCLDAAEECGVPFMAVWDAGRTELAPDTLTVAAIGPCRRSELPKRIARLQILKVGEQE